MTSPAPAPITPAAQAITDSLVRLADDTAQDVRDKIDFLPIPPRLRGAVLRLIGDRLTQAGSEMIAASGKEPADA